MFPPIPWAAFWLVNCDLWCAEPVGTTAFWTSGELMDKVQLLRLLYSKSSFLRAVLGKTSMSSMQRVDSLSRFAWDSLGLHRRSWDPTWLIICPRQQFSVWTVNVFTLIVGSAVCCTLLRLWPRCPWPESPYIGRSVYWEQETSRASWLVCGWFLCQPVTLLPREPAALLIGLEASLLFIYAAPQHLPLNGLCSMVLVSHLL